jgi:hypothetical protein
MEANIYVAPGVVLEGTTSRLTGLITREDGVTGFKPDTITLTLYDKATGTVINGRDAADVSAAVDVSGNLSLELTPADNAIVSSSKGWEVHRALIEWAWAPAREGAFTVEFKVANHERR